MKQTAQNQTFPARAGVHSYLPACLWRWLLAGLCLFCVASASAETAAAEAEARAIAAAEARVRTWVIPAGPLSAALTDFAAQSGLYLAGASAGAEGKSSPGLNGRYPTRQALARLLADSGLSYRCVDAGAVTLEPEQEAEAPEPLPPLSVEGEADEARPRPSGGADSAYRVKDANINVLGKKPLKDTPYSVEVYSSELMKNKQARSLADITKGDASVSLMADNLVRENNTPAIRGIRPDLTNGYKIDGINARVRSSDLPLEHLERIEILKGASGFLYGFGQPGGIINHILKRPTDQNFRSLSTQIMDSGLALIHGDVGGRLGADDRFGYRANLVHESGSTYIDDGDSRRNSASVAFDWEVTPDLVWQVDALLAKHVRKGGNTAFIPNTDGGINFRIGNPLESIDGSRRLGPSSVSRYGSIHETYSTSIFWHFAPDWTLNLAYRYSNNGREFLSSSILSDSVGNYSLFLINAANRFKSTQSQALISGVFTTGMISHELAIGSSYGEFSSFRDGDFIPNPNVGNLSNPVEVSNPFDKVLSYKDAHIEFATNRQQELFVSDTLHLGENWDIILGLRYGNLNFKFTNYDESAVTPSIAAVFRPMNDLSVYGSYVEALEAGSTAPNTAINANEIFPPLVSKQYEFGAKAEGDDWSASAALFRIERGLTYTTANNVFTQDGEARYQGLELNGKFRLSSRWLLTASAMWLDATNQKTTGGTLDGKRIGAVAREQVSLYSEYRMAEFPLTLTAGARYVSKRPLDSGNQFYVGDVTLFDIGMRYAMETVGQKKLILRLNVDNLTDEAYWLTRTGTTVLYQGPPLTIKLGAQFEF